MLEMDSNKKMTFIRVALGSCTPTPCRMEAVENFLMGKVPDKALIWEAGQMVVQKMIDLSGMRPSFVYKEKAVQGLFMRMLYPLTNHEN